MKNSKTGLGWKIELTFIFVGLVLLNTPFFKRNIPKTALSKTPETFTELFFTDHLNLPKQIEVGTKYEFSFSIQNLEHKDFTYVYEITAGNENIILEFEKDPLVLKHNELKTVAVTLSVTAPFERTKISVKLINKNQEIHYWVEQAEQEED